MDVCPHATSLMKQSLVKPSKRQTPSHAPLYWYSESKWPHDQILTPASTIECTFVFFFWTKVFAFIEVGHGEAWGHNNHAFTHSVASAIFCFLNQLEITKHRFYLATNISAVFIQFDFLNLMNGVSVCESGLYLSSITFSTDVELLFKLQSNWRQHSIICFWIGETNILSIIKNLFSHNF